MNESPRSGLIDHRAKSIIMSFQEEKKRGNLMTQHRFRWQTFSLDGKDGYESEWEQLKIDAIRQGAKHLIWSFNKWGKDDMIVKVFNDMNTKQEPVVITLDDARRMLEDKKLG